MKAHPRTEPPESEQSEPSLYGEYEDLIRSCEEARKLFDETDIYIQHMENGVTYTVVDPKGTLLSIGSMEETLTLQCGDVLLQYTDGVTEAKHEKQRFGEAGLLSAAAGAPSAKPEQLLPFIRRQIDLFAGQEPQFDDITMMGLQYLGPSEQ